MSDCQLGDYQIILEKNGRKLSSGQASLERIEYGRTLDAPSRANCSFVTNGPDCCGQLGAIDHWNTEMIVTVDDSVMWRGPVAKPIYSRDRVRIEAIDNLKWLDLRLIKYDKTYNAEDVSDIFIDIWERTVMSIDAPTASIVRYLSGVQETRKVEAKAHRSGWSVVSEMLDQGLDVTTFGSRVIVGLPAFGVLNLTDDDVQGDIEIVKDGDEFANRVIADAASNTSATYPPGDPVGGLGYPLVETVLSDSQLQDTQSAENAAKARWDFSNRGVRRVQSTGGLILLPSSNINPRLLVPGQLFNFTSLQTCYKATETLRLGSLNIIVGAGTEVASIDLQPLGGVQGLATV